MANVGDLANIAQLTRLDAVHLIGLIVKAAATAWMHKSNCRRFAQHLKLIGGLLEQLRVSELKKYPETREPLEQLKDIAAVTGTVAARRSVTALGVLEVLVSAFRSSVTWPPSAVVLAEVL